MKREEDLLGDIYTAFAKITTAIDEGVLADSWKDYWDMTAAEKFAPIMAGIREDLEAVNAIITSPVSDVGLQGTVTDTYVAPAEQPQPVTPVVVPYSSSPQEQEETESGTRSLSRGIDYVHETGPAIIHEGEQIIPSGGKGNNNQ